MDMKKLLILIFICLTLSGITQNTLRRDLWRQDHDTSISRLPYVRIGTMLLPGVLPPGMEVDPIYATDSALILWWQDTIKVATQWWVTSQAYLTAEADPVYAGDSANVVHFTDVGDLTLTGDVFSIGDSTVITIDAAYGGNIVLDADAFNVGLGAGVLQNNTVSIGDFYGIYNVAIGDSALYSNTIGSGNIATGNQALYSNTIGSDNIATGNQALYSNTIGSGNIATGNQALYSNTTGNVNIATGVQALYSNTIGSSNIATGVQALYSNTTGEDNIATGYEALYYNTEGESNIATGAQALYYNTTGNGNIATGYQALYSNTTGDENVALGSYSGYSNETDSSNIFIGDSAGYNATSSNKLWIDNSPTATPLIWGDFLADSLVINGDLTATGNIQITGDGSPKFQFQVIADTLCSVRVGIDTVRLHPPR